MSYILAALKKADQEHFLGSVPDLATPQDVQPAEHRTFRWYWIIVALLAVNTVLVVLLLKDRGAEVATAPVAERTPMAEQAAVINETPVATVQQSAPANDPVTQAAPQAGETPAGIVPVPPKTSPAATEKPARAGGEVVMLPQTVQTRNLELSVLPDEDLDMPGDGAAAPPEDTQLQGWFDLPQAVRNDLDPPRLDVHVYSQNPQGRFIMVELKKYREGQTLPNSMVLEEILPDGMVMSYRGERFRVDK